jgi:hypothetical protein
MSSESEIDGDDGGSARGKRVGPTETFPLNATCRFKAEGETHVSDSVWKQDGYNKYKVRDVRKKINSGWVIHATCG